MPTFALNLILVSLASVLILVSAFLIYTITRYAPIISRVFEEKPLFLPLRVAPEPGGDDVEFLSKDGLKLQGTYFRTQSRSRVGVLVFCHEYLSDRWSFKPYTNALRSIGYDLFTFDFRNHGASACDPHYRPLQWVTKHELGDLQAALAYLKTRPDHDPAGFGLFGVSRGGSTALVVAAKEPRVWGVITDGAFPTRGTMLSYIIRWAEIYVSNPYFWKCMPPALFLFVAWAGRVRSEYRLNCRFANVEKAVRRLSPRPWLLIHGQKDAYISPAIVEKLYEQAQEPKDIWIVPKAKHNRCREVAPEEYAARVMAFLGQFAPRRALVQTDTEDVVPSHVLKTLAPVPLNQVSGELTSSALTGEFSAPL
ncbi:MAG: hypothetical protein NVSMB9_04760 [Isosphaeraceae bacterium]